MIDRLDFEKLGTISHVIPAALDSATQTSWTVNTRLKQALAITKQLRRQDELLANERPEFKEGSARMRIDGIPVEPLGDDVLRAEPQDVLHILYHRLHAFHAFDKRMDDKSWSGLRDIYGYTGSSWTERSRGEQPPRRDVRVAMCLAADATFAPVRYGVVEAIKLRQATLRVDVLSVGMGIWSWAVDYPALARCLWIARTGLRGETLAFPAFTNAYERVIGDHRQTRFDEPRRAEDIAEIAQTLGELATEGIANAWIPGRTAARLNTPAIEALAREHPEWIPDEPDEDAEEAFARGASQLVIETLTGRRDPESAVAAMDALGRAVAKGHAEANA